jgi:hypothetical protein
MGTYWDAIQADQAAPGTGRYGKAVGAQQKDADYQAARAEAQKGIDKTRPAKGSIPERFEGWASGLTNTFVPQGAGAIAALGNVISGSPRDTGAVYRGYRDASRQQLEDLTSDYPVSSASGEASALMAGGEGLGLLGKAALASPAGQGAVAALQGSKLAKAAAPLAAATALRVNPGVLDKGIALAKAGLAGGATGGLLSSLKGGDLGDIETGAGWGALGGLGVEGVVAPVVKAAAGEAGNAGRWLKSVLGNPDLEPTVSQEDITAARNTAMRLAQRKGVTSANVMAKAAPYVDPVAGQLFGTEGQNLTGALARRGGDTGDTMRNLAYVRKTGRPDEIKQAATEHLGISPDEAGGNIDAIVKAGQAAVGPGYGDIEAIPHGVTNPEVERLLATPQGQRVQRYMEQRAGIRNTPTEGLTWAPMEVPQGGVGVNPVDAPSQGRQLIGPNAPPPDLGPAPQVRVPRGRAEPPSQGLSLTDWVRRQGGGIDTGGELGAQDLAGIGARSKYSPQQLSTLAEKAQSAGYFPPATSGQDVTTGGDLVRAMMEESRGNPIYARQADPKLAQSFEARAAAEAQNRSLANEHWNAQQDATAAHQTQQQADAEELAAWHRHMDEIGSADEYRSLGTGQEPPPEGYPGQAAPQTEPVQTTGLTPGSLVRMHQEAGKLVQRQFGVPVNTTPNLLMDAFRGRLGNLLAGDENGVGGLIPGYRQILDRSGDYKGAEGAYADFRNKLTSGRMDDFGKAVASLKDRDNNWIETRRRGAQAAMANDVAELYASGQLRGGKFAAPGVQQRLEVLFGKKGAQDFISKMERVSEQAAAEARMAPFSNSSSAAMLEAMNAQDEAAGQRSAQIGQTLAQGKIGMAAKLASKAGAYLKTPGSSTGYRNELGRIMTLKPEELKAFLEEMERQPPVPPVARVPGVSGITGGMALGQASPGAGGGMVQAASDHSRR